MLPPILSSILPKSACRYGPLLEVGPKALWPYKLETAGEVDHSAVRYYVNTAFHIHKGKIIYLYKH